LVLVTAPEKDNGTVVLDVRKIRLIERHDRIIETFDGLAAGETLIIINDHDPKPLWYQFSVERQNRFDWTYLEKGPEAWRVGYFQDGLGPGLPAFPRSDLNNTH